MPVLRIDMPLPAQAKLILETETKEIGVPAGPQDRVIQVYEGLVYMDFRKELMETRGYGEYERLDPAMLPDLFMAFRTSLSEGTEVFHNNVRERWRNGDPEVMGAMETWGSYAEQGKQALLTGDYDELDRLINANFDLRTTLYKISEGNLEMIEAARGSGASANFAGSGGAVVGAFRGEEMYRKLQQAMSGIGVAVIRPQVL
ncbi:MAG: hypothetical protein WKF37_24615 [Bryobacteraceae bacterium]